MDARLPVRINRRFQKVFEPRTEHVAPRRPYSVIPSVDDHVPEGSIWLLADRLHSKQIRGERRAVLTAVTDEERDHAVAHIVDRRVIR